MNRWRLGLRILRRFARVTLLLRRAALPEVVDGLTSVAPTGEREDERRLRYGVDAILDRRGHAFRCLPRALVLYSLLTDQGDKPRLVIGLPLEAATSEAHAWVELEGRDVGPSPGRGAHQPLIAYPRE